MNRNRVTRDAVIRTLVGALKPLDYVHALYEGGAAAFNRVDEWSDIDLYLVADNNKVDDAFDAVETALGSLSPIKRKFDVSQLPWPGVSQAFYSLKRASEYLLIDLAVIKLSGPEKFLAPEIHGNAIFYFNKSKKVKMPILNKEELADNLQRKLERLKDRFAMFNIFVQKEINRGNWLEALDLYYNVTLASLVEALRARYNSFHYDFKMRYIHYELPAEIVVRLQNLYFVKDKKELQSKYREASKWFLTAISEVSTTH